MPQWTVQSRHQSPRAPWRRRQVASPPGGGGGGEVAGITHAHVGGFPGAAPPVPKKESSPRTQRIATARRLASTRRPLLSAPCLSSGQPAPRRRARDRKSLVWGKGCSGRVDRVVCLTFTKNKT